jgi:glycerol-3-phosphate dehydrogenase
MSAAAFDLAVIGAGVNGCAIARDAAGRGLRVLLCDQGDLAGGTSSVTSKLIHGGLRYLEQGEFRMVREALRERRLLLRTQPHLVRPLRLILPHDSTLRPRWMLRLGLSLYDHIGGARDLPAARALRLTDDPVGAPLRAGCKYGFAFSDGWTDDARLVLSLARDAARRGAEVFTYTAFLGAEPRSGGWELRLQARDAVNGAMAGSAFLRQARVLVNAAGPWVTDVAARVESPPPRARVRLVQGSHLVLPRWYAGDHGYLLQAEDRRVVFVLPWHAGHLLVGTTDTLLEGEPQAARVRPEEIQYLCRTVGQWFRHQPQPADVVDSFVGVRPLFDDGAANPSRITRDRRLIRMRDPLGAVILHVFGGKLTTHRALAAEALALLRQEFPGAGPAWTHRVDGGEAPQTSLEELTRRLREQVPDWPEAEARALAERHGAAAAAVIGSARRAADLGEDFGAGLRAAELEYCVRHEWVRCADDLLRRRTRCGFRLSPAERQRVAESVQAAQSSVPENR